MSHEGEDDIFQYGDPKIATKDAPVPTWLICFHVFWVVFGLIWFWLYWNGSWGWLDRGYWGELQTIANTRNAVINYNDPAMSPPPSEF